MGGSTISWAATNWGAGSVIKSAAEAFSVRSSGRCESIAPQPNTASQIYAHTPTLMQAHTHMDAHTHAHTRTFWRLCRAGMLCVRECKRECERVPAHCARALAACVCMGVDRRAERA